MLTDDNDHLPQPAASGQELAFAFPTERSPKGPVHFESCRTPYGCLSAIAAIQWLRRGSPQWAGYLPVSAKAGRTHAIGHNPPVRVVI